MNKEPVRDDSRHSVCRDNTPPPRVVLLRLLKRN